MEITTSKNSYAMQNYGIDVVSAAISSLLVSPFICIVDRSIIENASGARPLKHALSTLAKEFVTSPWQFIKRKEFLLIYGLYSSTYVAANTIDTSCDIMNKSNQWPKFLGTTAVNMTLCIAKDREFTRMFGVRAPSAVPLATYALFAARDSLTVAASFNFPKVVSGHLQHDYGYTKHVSDTFAQLSCPAAVQFLSTPLHLLGLDLYNHPIKTSSKRIQFISKEYLKSALARIGRIGPAFGIGGVSNNYIRNTLKDQYIP